MMLLTLCICKAYAEVSEGIWYERPILWMILPQYVIMYMFARLFIHTRLPLHLGMLVAHIGTS